MDEVTCIPTIIIHIKIQFWTEAQLLCTTGMWHLGNPQSHGWQRSSSAWNTQGSAMDEDLHLSKLI